jgi:hypothetical protein
VDVYAVIGGWQAQDKARHIACFGRTEPEARAALEAARKRAEALIQQYYETITKHDNTKT